MINSAPTPKEQIKNRVFEQPVFKTYLECLEESVKDYVLSIHLVKNGQFTNRAINCFSKSMASVIEVGVQRPKIINDKFSGYQIPYTRFANLRNSALHAVFKFIFIRAENSTYHRNDAKFGHNGYTHWYIGTDAFKQIMLNTKIKFKTSLDQFKLYRNKSYDLSNLMSPSKNDKFNGSTHFRVKHSIFWKEYNIFEASFNKSFPILLKNAVYIDDDYVYFNNTIKFTNVFSDYKNKGRIYTVFSSLEKKFRKRLFHEYMEIDMNCAVQSIALNLYRTDSKTGKMKYSTDKFKEHNKLIENKQLFRTLMGANFSIDSKTAKTAILQMSYAPNSNVIRNYCTTPKSIVKAKKGIKRFKKECQELQTSIIDRYYYAEENDENLEFKIGDLRIGEIRELVQEAIRVHNLKLKGCGKGKNKPPRIYFRICELIEHQIRKEMMRFVCSVCAGSTNSEIYQVHDAVIIPGRVNLSAMKEHIKNTIGFDINLTSEIY